MERTHKECEELATKLINTLEDKHIRHLAIEKVTDNLMTCDDVDFDQALNDFDNENFQPHSNS